MKHDLFVERLKLRFKFMILSGSDAPGIDSCERVYRMAFEHALAMVNVLEEDYRSSPYDFSDFGIKPQK